MGVIEGKNPSVDPEMSKEGKSEEVREKREKKNERRG